MSFFKLTCYTVLFQVRFRQSGTSATRSKYSDFMDLLSKEHLKPIVHAGPNRCFACGAGNPAGLHLEFLTAPDGSVVSFPAVNENFEGYPGYLHGGIIATLLDEAMSKAIRALNQSAMTRKMEIDYRRPGPGNVQIRVVGRIVRSEDRKYFTEASILNSRGTVLAHGKGLFIQALPMSKGTGQPHGRPAANHSGGA
jgi:uncharacterized protein (TIGR00369 family)